MTENGKVRDAPKFLRVIRMDSVPLNGTYFTEEGYLRDKPILTSTGIFEYMNADGSIRRELRPPEEVFDPKSLASFKGKPVCFTHDNGLLDKDNVGQAQVGTILSEGERDGNDVRAEIIIYDTDELKRCHMRELSLGYSLDIDETPGTWNGERYDAIQRNIFVNHLAVVKDARAGEQARLNLDSRDSKTTLIGGKRMSKKTTKVASRYDQVLSDEELKVAIEEYKKRRAAEGNTDSVDEEMPEDVEPKATKEPVEAEPQKNDIDKKLATLEERRARRDEQGDPKDVEGAMGFIAEMDEDIDLYKNIIDTLLAKNDFNEAAPAEEMDSVDELNKLKKDADDVVEEDVIAEEEEAPAEEEEAVEDDELVTDEDDLEDEEPIDEEEEEEEEELATDSCDDLKSGKRMDAASIDRLVSQKIMLGELGDAVGVKGLARRNVSDAKKAIIKAVRPEMRLDGKSSDYINAAFEYARAEIRANRKKGTAAQKQQMFNMDSKMESDTGADAARRRMIARQNKRD